SISWIVAGGNTTYMALSRRMTTSIALDPAHDRLLARVAREARSLITVLVFAGCAHPAPSGTTAARPLQTADRQILWRHPEDPEWRTPAPPVSHLRFETTKGVFVLELVREWGPIGADRLYNLARLGYYDDTRVHRVNANYIAQFGLSGNPAVNAAWKDQYLKDDPPRSTNTR